MLLDTSYLSEYGTLRTNKRVWLPPHKIFSVLRTSGFLGKDWNGWVGGWMGLVGCLLGYDVDAG